MGGTEASGTAGAEFLCLEVPAGSAALAAGTAGSSGSGALAHNPAGILGQRCASISFTHFSSLADTSYEQLEALYPGWLAGDWAVRVFYAHTNDLVEIDEFGRDMGAIDNHDLLFQSAYARSFISGWKAGIALTFFERALAGYDSQGVALDLGVQYEITKLPIVLGASIRNFGSVNALEKDTASLPSVIKAGAAVTISPWPGHVVKTLVDFQQPLEQDETPGAALGLEYGLNEIYVLRGGYRFINEAGAFSLGAGLFLKKSGLEYAFQPLGDLGTNHRLTFSYFFRQPGPEKSPASSEPAAPARKKAGQAIPGLRNLKVEKREFTGTVSYKTPKLKPGVRGWSFEVRDHEGCLVKKFSSADRPPKTLNWDGRDSKGEHVSLSGKYSFIFKTGGRKITAYEIPRLEPAFKFRFQDGARLEPQVCFEFAARPKAGKWSMIIRDQKQGKMIRTIFGSGDLPETITWDGKNKSRRLADTSRKYQYDLKIIAPNGSEFTLSRKIKDIPARKVPAPEGSSGLLIYGIMFDYRSARLKPEMSDKIQAAAQVLKKHKGKAKAVCEGHTDEKGPAMYNQRLSERRAGMVEHFLAQQAGVSRRSLFIKGFGQSRPDSKLRTREGRKRNRRVDIRMTIPKP